MTAKIYWHDILNTERRRPSTSQDITDHRNEFEKDYDRIVSSSSLRRLQDKAQVFPLQANDFTRTRLTHSIEVSAIARSLGNWLEKWLIENNKINTRQIGYIPAILAVAGLVHDLGNPPFGHYGEDVIKNWFEKWFKTDEFKKLKESYPITEEEKNDFLNFDGNAQGIRILTKLQFLNDQYGINFTYGTLSSLLKYPWSSSSEIGQAKQKFGYFQKDKDPMEDVILKTTRVEGLRNPLAFLLEASDDIAYIAADVEDGVKKGVIDWDIEFPKLITKINDELDGYYEKPLNKILKKHIKSQQENIPDYKLTSVQNFRVWAQGVMIKEAMSVFEQKYENIMTGTLKGDLISHSKKAECIAKYLGELQKYCYNCKEVLTLELIGDKVLNDLLTTFIEAVTCNECIDKDGNIKMKHKHGKILSMISSNFKFVSLLDYPSGSKKRFPDLSLYERLLLVTDFISGMTDSYAVDLHQKLNGVKLP